MCPVIGIWTDSQELIRSLCHLLSEGILHPQLRGIIPFEFSKHKYLLSFQVKLALGAVASPKGPPAPI